MNHKIDPGNYRLREQASKYGPEWFSVEILADTDVKYLGLLEAFFIDHLKPTLNFYK